MINSVGEWTPMYINTTIANKSHQEIDPDYWNALWNMVIVQADNNTKVLEYIFGDYDDWRAILTEISAVVEANKLDTEAYATGKRDGVDVGSSDPAYHNNAKYYNSRAAYNASEASDWSDQSEAWSHGEIDGTPIDSSNPAYHMNSRYYANIAGEHAGNAYLLERQSEAWAVGTMGGAPVESTDDQYHNNAKYYALEAATSATDAVSAKDDAVQAKNDAVSAKSSATGAKNQAQAAAQSAINAKNDAVSAKESAYSSKVSALTAKEDSEAYAIGKRDGTDVSSSDPAYHNNAKYWSDQAAASVSSLAPAYSSSATYDVGDYVLYNGSLYRCTTAITTAEEWTVAHWTAAKMSEDVSDVKSALDDLKSHDFVFVGADGNLYYHEEE